MTANVLIVAALVAYAFSRFSNRLAVRSREDLKWWQWPVLLVAVIIALLIVVTPEFFALGFLGDAAFFDLLVLLTTLQLHCLGVHARTWLADLVSRAVFWVMTPRMSYLLVLSVWAGIADLVGTIAAAWNRVSS